MFKMRCKVVFVLLLFSSTYIVTNFFHQKELNRRHYDAISSLQKQVDDLQNKIFEIALIPKNSVENVTNVKKVKSGLFDMFQKSNLSN